MTTAHLRATRLAGFLLFAVSILCAPPARAADSTDEPSGRAAAGSAGDGEDSGTEASSAAPPRSGRTQASSGRSAALSRSQRRLRRGLEIAGGAGGLIVGASAGAGLGLLLDHLVPSNAEEGIDRRAREAVRTGLFVGIGALLGGTVATPGGVTLAGRAFGAEGTYGASLLGTALGVVADGLILVGWNALPVRVGWAQIIALSAVTTALPLAGAVISYEISHAKRTKRAATFAPSVRPRPNGLSVGFNLRF